MGDHYVVNGVKTWTTMAQYADWMFCLVRTSNEDIRQLGISFILIDMNTPGISVKPIVTLDTPADGYQEINMVYFEDVKVPKENLVGEQGKGWTCAKYLLEFDEAPSRLRAMNHLREQKATLMAWSAVKVQIAVNDTEVQIAAMEYTEPEYWGCWTKRGARKLYAEDSWHRVAATTELAMDIRQLRRALDQSTRRRRFSGSGADLPTVLLRYFNTRKVSIYAGSNEISAT